MGRLKQARLCCLCTEPSAAAVGHCCWLYAVSAALTINREAPVHLTTHEQTYRGEDAMQKLEALHVTVCGAGALGSQLVDNLVRQGFRQMKVIDCDRVEPHNAGSQLYGLADAGGRKVDVLRNRVFNSTEVEIQVAPGKLIQRNARQLLRGAGLVVDTFDNHAGRQHVTTTCAELQLPCLHAGLFEDYCEAIWNDRYRVPQDAENDVCEYPLARNLVLLSVAIVSEIIVQFALTGERLNRTATLRDFAVCELEAP